MVSPEFRLKIPGTPYQIRQTKSSRTLRTGTYNTGRTQRQSGQEGQNVRATLTTVVFHQSSLKSLLVVGVGERSPFGLARHAKMMWG